MLVFLAAVSATESAALPDSVRDRAHLFADCAGRFSAVAEHARMFDGAASEEAEAQRDIFVALLNATLPDLDGAEPDSLDWRIQSKAAHAALLSTAYFSMHSERARLAREAAARHVAICSALILPV